MVRFWFQLVAEVEERQSAKQPAKKKLKKATANDDDINIGDTETATHFALEKSLEQVLMEQEEREESGQRSRSRSKIITLASTGNISWLVFLPKYTLITINVAIFIFRCLK